MPALAKLTRPKVHRALPRERLFARLDELRDGALIWVMAPPGSGKTTLVASYIEARKLRCAWYQLDAGDEDLGTYFYYLAQTAPVARGKRTPSLPVLTPEYLSDLPAFCRLFFRAFFARFAQDTCLVLDNYHELPSHALLHKVLQHAMIELPEGILLLVISRAEPPQDLSTLKLKEQLAILDWSDLRMSLDETRHIAQSRTAIDEVSLRRIHKLSDGWAAGIALTLQRMVNQRGKAAAEHETRAELFDYFAAQVLQSETPATQRFLKYTALLPNITAAMADSLCEREDSDALLDELYRRGVFIDRRNTRPAVYNYHDLFRAFLLTQLEQTLSSDELLYAQRAAAQLLEADDRDHAVRLYLKVRDWPAAVRVILASAQLLIEQQRGALLREWIAAVPSEIIAAQPWLNYYFGVTLSRTAPAEARRHFEVALTSFAASADIAAELLLCTEVVFTYMHEFADLTLLDPWIARLQRLLKCSLLTLSPAIELRMQTACLFCLCFRQPQPQELETCVARVFELLDANIPADIAAISCGTLMMHLYIMADMSAFSRTAKRFKDIEATGTLAPITIALGSMQLGHGAMRAGDLTEARRLFERAMSIGAEHAIPLPTLYVYSHLGLAFCAIAQGNLLQAETHRKQLEMYWQSSRKIDSVSSSRIQLWIACHRGQWDEALRLAQEHRDRAHACGVFMLMFESLLQLAIVYAQMHRPRECIETLQPVRGMLADTAYEHFTYEVDLVAAYSALLEDDYQQCHDKLRSGFAGAKRDEGMFLLRMQPELLARLASEALTANIESDHVFNLIRRLHLRPPRNASTRWPWPLRVYTLGRFQVMRDGAPLEFSRKAPKKALALLKAVIAFGGKNVREQLLLDTFWSDEEGDAAARSLTATLHRLRTLIDDTEAIVQQGGALSLEAERVWVDAWEFEEQLANTAAQARGESLELYRGGFLVEDQEEPWSITMRERLRSKFIHGLTDYTRELEANANYEQAVTWYLRGLDADPVIEQFYQGLMRCYVMLDRRSEAAAAYRRLKQILSITLSLKPSASTEKLYRSLRLEQSDVVF